MGDVIDSTTMHINDLPIPTPIPTGLNFAQALLLLLLSFGKIKNRGYRAFLEIKLVCFDLKLIALGVIYNFSHPLPGQFHYCFTQRGVLCDIHNG